MPKKAALCFLICLVVLLMLPACSLSGTDNPDGVTTTVVTSAVPETTKPEVFAGNIPEYKFSNYVDAYDTDTTYSFTVKCSQAEYDEYFQLLMQCGYTIDATQNGGTYIADNANGYNVNVNFTGTQMLVAFTKN